MRKSLYGLVLVGSGLWGGFSFAQEADLFKKLDADGDGTITAEEAGADKKSIFDRLVRKADKNEDGKLSREEFEAGLKDAGPQPAAPGGFGDNPASRFANIDPKEIFKRLDRDGDGKIQKSEAPERMQENFSRVDANGDGEVDAGEFERVAAMMQGRPPEAKPGQPRPEMPRPEGGFGPPGGFPPFARIFDKDQDGELSADEIASATEALKKLDKNGDGKLTGEELAGGFGDGPPPGMARPGAGPEGPNPREILDRLKQADANNDGKLSKEEAPERLRERFDRIDTNSDGFIDEGEVRGMLERFREQFGAGRPEGVRRPESGERPERPRRPDDE